MEEWRLDRSSRYLHYRLFRLWSARAETRAGRSTMKVASSASSGVCLPKRQIPSEYSIVATGTLHTEKMPCSLRERWVQGGRSSGSTSIADALLTRCTRPLPSSNSWAGAIALASPR